MKRLFAYIRVSTAKQGLGVSLQEQKAAIERYAERSGAQIIQWFEERKTAAKAGRPEFARMVKLLRRGKAHGVIIHKIDRSTRNYRDWADINELIESGIDVYFASDDLDMRSRGGRLAADIQVVVAVDYIRNLREEALKGIHGRLKQGILPNRAPIGYLDRGAGKPKEIDPAQGPLVRQLFELYGTASMSLREVTEKAVPLGLRNRTGNPLRLNQIHEILRNPFYAGLIRSTRFGVFPGAHVPLVRRLLFDRVQQILDGKFARRTLRHAFMFRRFIHCATCGRSLVGSLRKGRVYYRCPTMTCPTTSLREDAIEIAAREGLVAIQLNDSEKSALRSEIVSLKHNEAELAAARRTALTSTLSATNARLTRLTDLLIDGAIDQAVYNDRRSGFLSERQRAEQELADVTGRGADLLAQTEQIVELAGSAVRLYESAVTADQKRNLLQTVMSNVVATGKNLEFSLREPFATIAARHSTQNGGPHWNTGRTFLAKALISLASEWKEEMWARLQDILEPEVVQAGDPAAQH